jgi:excisionase family DNA binding protein
MQNIAHQVLHSVRNVCRNLHMPDEQYLTTGQVADRLGVHRTTVHHWERNGKLRAALEVNGTRLFLTDDIDTLAATREASS